MIKKRPRGTKNEQKTSQWDVFWSNARFFGVTHVLYLSSLKYLRAEHVFLEQCIEIYRF